MHWNEHVNNFHTQHSLTPPDLCLTLFKTFSMHWHTPTACHYCGTLLWHSIYMLHTRYAMKWARSPFPHSTPPYTPWPLPYTISYLLRALPHTFSTLYSWYFARTRHLQAASLHNYNVLHQWVFSQFPHSTPPHTPWTLPHTICDFMWALPLTLSMLLLWCFALTLASACRTKNALKWARLQFPHSTPPQTPWSLPHTF